MKIRITKMVLQNFKKVRNQEVNFSDKVLISGGNRMGKTTIYDAYLWCLFGTTSKQSPIVQTLDADNNIIHKIETSVTVFLDVDGQEVKVERRLSEKWKAKDTACEKLIGTETIRLIDDIPYSVRDYNNRLSSFCDYKKWMMLSNINNFWEYKVDDRRKMLMSMVGDIDETSLMSPYPVVYKGVVEQKKELEDIQTQYKITRKKADEELNLIPAKIQAQDALRVNADFDTLQMQKDALDKEIANIDADLQGIVTDNSAEKEYHKRRNDIEGKINSARINWHKTQVDRLMTIGKQIADANKAIIEEKSIVAEKDNVNFTNKRKLVDMETHFDELRNKWQNVNEKEFSFGQTDVCPVCHRPYTEDMKRTEYENAVIEFNTHKSKELESIQNEATLIKQQISVLKGNVNAYEQIHRKTYEANILAKEANYNDLRRQEVGIQAEEWEERSEYKELAAILASIEKDKPLPVIDTTTEDKKDRKAKLSAERDNIIKQLAGKDVNERIEQEKSRLNERSLTLAQIIADGSEALRQIREYKKTKVEVIENKVNSYFSLIRWKFYEQNISNDDMREICTAIDKDGVDYDNTNDGTVINMGIDIISGMSKAFGIYVPLFVDRKESAEDVIATPQQTIYLQCIYKEPLKIQNL